MSRQTALENINLQQSDRWGHTQYSIEYHRDYMAKKTGLAPEDPNLLTAACDVLQLDLRWNTSDGIVSWKDAGRTTDMGHASYESDGSDQRQPATCPFNTLEEVWEFDAVAEYGLPEFAEQVAAYESEVSYNRQSRPGLLTTGGYYRTIVSGAIDSFGWDMLLMGASDPAKMERVFDSFFQRTLFHMKAWAETSVEVLIQHDDFVWTDGAFMSPDIYRRVIIPRYAELWKPAHAAGKKVLFCSDGNFTEFAEDVAGAGADGFIFEPCMDFGHMAGLFGQSHCLVGSYVDCRDLTFGRWEKVQSDIDRTIDKYADCKGAIFAVGNHMPANIPDEMMDRFFDYLLPRLQK